MIRALLLSLVAFPAAHFGVNRQTVYNRAASPRFPDWEIIVRREVK